MKDKITAFINNFKSLHVREIEDAFMCGNCYWFAHILTSRFGGNIMYMPVDNHFISKIDGRYFDVRGDITRDVENAKMYFWNTYINEDASDYYHVMRDCVNQV